MYVDDFYSKLEAQLSFYYTQYGDYGQLALPPPAQDQQTGHRSQ